MYESCHARGWRRTFIHIIYSVSGTESSAHLTGNKPPRPPDPFSLTGTEGTGDGGDGTYFVSQRKT